MLENRDVDVSGARLLADEYELALTRGHRALFDTSFLRCAAVRLIYSQQSPRPSMSIPKDGNGSTILDPAVFDASGLLTI